MLILRSVYFCLIEGFSSEVSFKEDQGCSEGLGVQESDSCMNVGVLGVSRSVH